MEKRHPTGKPTASWATEAKEKVFGTAAMRAVLAWATFSTSVSKNGASMSAKDTVPVKRLYYGRLRQAARPEILTCLGDC